MLTFLKFQVFVNRGIGIYGETRFTWQVLPRNDGFIQHQGEVVFADKQQETAIVIQVFTLLFITLMIFIITSNLAIRIFASYSMGDEPFDELKLSPMEKY